MNFINDFMIGSFSAAFSSIINYNLTDIIRKKLNSNQKIKWSFKIQIQKCISFVKGLSLAEVPRYSLIQGFNFSLNEAYKQIFCPLDPQNEKIFFLLGNIASGSVAGATSTLLVYPLDIARSLLIEDMNNTVKKYNGFADCIKKLYQKNGFKGLYRYFGITVSSVALYRGIYFGAYDTAKVTILNSQINIRNNMAKLVFAILVVELATITASPLDLIRRELQMQENIKERYLSYVYQCI